MYMNFIKKYIYNSTKILSSNIFFCAMILILIIILIVGTIMQKEYGLKSIQEEYFNSFLILHKYFLFPGGKLIITLIFISILTKTILDKIKKIGTFLIHLGLILFILFTFLFLENKDEKYIIIKEGEKNNCVINNHSYNIEIINNKLKTHSIIKIPTTSLKKNLIYKPNNVPFDIKFSYFFNNSNVKINNKLNKEFFFLNRIPYFVENEYNKTSIEINLLNKKNNVSIKKLLFIDNLINEKNLLINNIDINISLKKSFEILPFDLYLIKFNKINYKGTNSAKSFESEIILKDKNIEWKYKIKMNKPLRYKNYTFYQSSFIENDINTTILYVSTSSRINYIYLSCFIILIGFIIHILNLVLTSGKISYE